MNYYNANQSQNADMPAQPIFLWFNLI